MTNEISLFCLNNNAIRKESKYFYCQKNGMAVSHSHEHDLLLFTASLCQMVLGAGHLICRKNLIGQNSV